MKTKITFGLLAALSTSAFAQSKVKQKSTKTEKSFCEKTTESDGCSTAADPNGCNSKKAEKVAAKDQADCESKGGQWKTPEVKK